MEESPAKLVQAQNTCSLTNITNNRANRSPGHVTTKFIQEK